MKDPYEVLGVGRDADEATIKSAFRKLAMAHHPDRNPGDEEAKAKFQEVNEAYQTLSDGQKRAAFDRFGHAGPQPGGSSFHANFHSAFADIFEAFRAQAMQRNRDVAVMIEVPLEKILTEHTIDVTAPSATGPRTVSVTIPAGMPSGARLRVVGAGDHSRSDLPPGDLYVTVLVLPHDRFEVVGENLVCEVHIDAFEAMLGALLTVQGLDGQAISVRIPPGTNHGSGIRLTGQGLPNVNQASSRGDLIVRVLVRVPALNDEQAALVRQAQALGRPAA